MVRSFDAGGVWAIGSHAVRFLVPLLNFVSEADCGEGAPVTTAA